MNLQFNREEDFNKLLELAGKHYNSSTKTTDAVAIKAEYIAYKRLQKIQETLPDL